MREKLLTRKNFFQLLLLDVMVEKKHLLVVLQASDHRPKSIFSIVKIFLSFCGFFIYKDFIDFNRGFHTSGVSVSQKFENSFSFSSKPKTSFLIQNSKTKTSRTQKAEFV